MGIYRLELASTGRAVCRNTECKDNQVKIPKGALRHGAFVDFGEHQSWAWKHWGCVTPQMIANLNDTIDGDLEMLDGYDEIDEESQEKVRKALKDGHVADEDWNGDLEQNRPGMKGFRSPAKKKKAREEAKEAKARAAEEAGNESPTKAPAKKRGRAKKEEDIEASGADQGPTKTKSPSKKRRKVKKEENDEEAEVVEEPKKAKPVPRKRDRAIKGEDNQGDEVETTPKQSKAASRKRAKAIKEEDGLNGSEAAPKQSKAPTKKLAKKPTVKVEDDDEPVPRKKPRIRQARMDSGSGSSPEAAPPKGTRSRGGARKTDTQADPIKEEEGTVDEVEQEVVEEAPKKRGRKKVTPKASA